MKTSHFIALMTLVGCAANSGVVPMGADTYFVSRQAATGFAGASDLKAETLKEANLYCLGQRKSAEVISMTEAQPPYLLGNYPKAEVQFKCVGR